MAAVETQFSLDVGLSTGGSQSLGYDAVKSSSTRSPLKQRVYTQDMKLAGRDRERAIATSQDLVQNFALTAWAVRKHLDYVSNLRFQSTTQDDRVNQAVEAYMRGWGTRMSCDVRRRHSLRRMIRMAEARRTVDGDFGFLKVGGFGPDRGRLQAVEAYRVRQPDSETFRDQKLDDEDRERWTDGIEVDAKGATRRYAIHRTDRYGNYSFEKFVNARNMVWIGYYDRFDQVRGISPLLAGMNTFRDVYQGIDYTLAKMKVGQLFGLVFYRDAVEGFGQEPTLDADGDGLADSGYEVDFSGGPQLLDLLPGDKAEFLESKTPAAETVDFMRFVMSIALKSLDLPDSFLREAETNFFGSRAAWIQYQRSAESKQQDLIEALDELTAWRLGMAIADGELVLPAGATYQDLKWNWEPQGMPWWDSVKEATGNKAALAAGLDNIERVCLMNGSNVQDNIDINAKWFKYSLDRHGIPLVWAESTTAHQEMPSIEGTEVEDE